MDFHKKPATGGTGRREIRNLNLAVSVTCCLIETKILGAVGTLGPLGAGEPSEEFRTSGITKRFQPWFKRVFGFFGTPGRPRECVVLPSLGRPISAGF